MEFMNGMIQWLTQDWLVSLLDESVFLNEWFKDKNTFKSPFWPPKKKKCAQELIGEIYILQHVSDSGIGIDFTFLTLMIWM